MADANILLNQKLVYQILMQKKDGNNNILMSIPGNPEVDIPNSIVGNDTYLIEDGALDQPLSLLNASIDFVFLLSTQEISYKLNSPTSAPTKIRAGGCALIDGADITDVLITYSNVAGVKANLMFIQAKRQEVA